MGKKQGKVVTICHEEVLPNTIKSEPKLRKIKGSENPPPLIPKRTIQCCRKQEGSFLENHSTTLF